MNQALYENALKIILELTDEEIFEKLKASGINATIRQYPEQEQMMTARKDKASMMLINSALIDLMSEINDISNNTGYVLPEEQQAKLEEVQKFLLDGMFGKK